MSYLYVVLISLGVNVASLAGLGLALRRALRKQFGAMFGPMFGAGTAGTQAQGAPYAAFTAAGPTHGKAGSDDAMRKVKGGGNAP